MSFDAYSTCSRASPSVARGNFRGHSVSDRSARGNSSDLDGREAPSMHIYGTSLFLGLVSNLRFGNKTLLNGFSQLLRTLLPTVNIGVLEPLGAAQVAFYAYST